MAWILDLDGVVWLGDRPIPGAAAAVERLRAAGERVGFVTNNSYRTRDDVGAALQQAGIDPGGDVVTSAMAAATLVEPGETVLLCAGPGARAELEERGARVVETGAADVVVVGFHPEFDYSRMTAAVSAVRAGARLVATNDDATYPTPVGVIPGGGAILASIVTAAGVAPVVAGKPYGAMVGLARARLGDAGVAVGDRPDTDGRFAYALGYRFALVLSGVTTAGDLPVDPAPHLVAPDLAELVAQVLDRR